MSRCILRCTALGHLISHPSFYKSPNCCGFSVLISRSSLVSHRSVSGFAPRRQCLHSHRSRASGVQWTTLCKTSPTSRQSRIFGSGDSTQILVCRFSTKKAPKLPFEKDTNVAENVLIFQHNNDRFYRLLSFFGSVQLLFWGYLAFFSFSTLRDVPVDESSAKEEDRPWWRLLNLGNNKYKNGIALLCVSVGYIIFFISVMYPMRAVQSLWLLKGGNSVGITTYAPFGKKLSFVAQLENINCVQSRAQASSQVPIKVKGKWFFYLLDKKGTFHNPELFDYAVGLRRKV